MYLSLFLETVFVNNIVLALFLGICPFVGVSKRLSTALSMGGAVTFVMLLASTSTFLVYNYVLTPLNLEFLNTVSFILIIAVLVQFVEIVIKKISAPLYKMLGIYLPLITTNCAILGVALLNIKNNYNLTQMIVYSLANATGFVVAIGIFSAIRERLELLNIPKAFKGVPVSFVVAGLLSLAFMAFKGI